MARFLVRIIFKDKATKQAVSNRLAQSKGKGHEVLPNTWLMRGRDSHSASGLKKWIQTFIDEDDRIFVANITDIKYSNAADGTNAWLRRY